MIDIIRYNEMLNDIRGAVNLSASEDREKIVAVISAPTEPRLMKKLKDKDGIYLCANYPNADENAVNEDNVTSANECVWYVLEKVSSGSQTDGQELEHYFTLQKIAMRIRDLLLDGEFGCGNRFKAPTKVRIEWEYEIYGGFNGLSIGFDLNG